MAGARLRRHAGTLAVLVAAVLVLVAAWWSARGRVLVALDGPLPSLCAGATVRVPVWVLAGPATGLDPAAGDVLSYRVQRAEGPPADGPRSPLPGPIRPFRPVRTFMTIEAPAEGGPVRLRLGVVREGAFWHSSPTGAVPATVGPPSGAFEWVDGPRVRTTVAQGPVTIRGWLRHLGCRALDPSRGDAVGVWIEAGGVVREGRIALPRTVAPGATVEVAGVVEAPPRPGEACVTVAPVLADTGWGRAGAAQPSCGHRLGAPTFVAAVRAVAAPDAAFAGEPFVLKVRLRNTGRRTWEPDRVRVGARFLSAGRLEDTGARVRLPRPVPPGESVERSIPVPVPADAAGRTLRVVPGVVEDGVMWAADADILEGRRLPVLAFAVGPARLSWSVEGISVSPWASAGGTIRLAVRVRNEGVARWDPAAGDALGVQVVAADGSEREHRIALPGPVDPGQGLWGTGEIPAPSAIGAATVRVEPVREGARWFGPPRSGRSTATIRVVALAPELAAAALGALLAAWVFARRARPPPAVAMAAAWALAWLAAERSILEQNALHPWPAWSRVVLGVAAGVSGMRWIAGRSRAAPWFAVPALALAGLFAVDGVYLGFFGQVLAIEHAAAAAQAGDVAGSLVASVARSPVAPAVWTAVTVGEVIAGVGWARRRRGAVGPAGRPAGRPRGDLGGGRRSGGRARRAAVLLWAAGVLGLLEPLAEAVTGAEGRRIYDGRIAVARFGVAGAHVLALAARVREGARRALPSDGGAALRARLRARRPPPSPAFGAARGKDVVVIQAEALADWVLAASVGGAPVMPTLRRWAEAGTHVALADQTGDGNTSDAELLALASLYPLERGAAAFLRAHTPHHTLAQVLGAAGVRTISAHPFRGSFWNRSVVHPAYGFERSWFDDAFAPGPTVGWGLSDRAFLGQLARKIVRSASPVFVYAITLGLHHPYEAMPPRLSSLDLAAEPDLAGRPLGNYLLAARHLDDALADFERTLRNAGRWDDTVVVVFGDHDPRLPPGGRLAAFQAAGATRVPVPTVPLVLHGAGRRPPARRLAGAIDIAPTLLDLLGFVPPETMIGASVFAPVDRPVLAPRFGVVAGDRILSFASSDGVRCTRPDGRALPSEACDDLEAWARDERALSRMLLDVGAARILRSGDP